MNINEAVAKAEIILELVKSLDKQSTTRATYMVLNRKGHELISAIREEVDNHYGNHIKQTARHWGSRRAQDRDFYITHKYLHRAITFCCPQHRDSARRLGVELDHE